MRTHNICFHGEIRKISVFDCRKHPVLSYGYKIFIFVNYCQTVIVITHSKCKKLLSSNVDQLQCS